MGVFPRQAIRGEHVEPINQTHGRAITQPLQLRANKSRAADTGVDETLFLGKLFAIAGDARFQRRDLAVDGAALAWRSEETRA